LREKRFLIKFNFWFVPKLCGSENMHILKKGKKRCAPDTLRQYSG
jgi:hypothetical protein